MTERLSWPLNQKVYEKALKESPSLKGPKTRTNWSRKDLSYLKKHAGVKSYKEIALELGKTQDAIASMIYKMKKGDKRFFNISNWTKEEDKYLVNNYGTFKNEELGKKLGRSAAAVQIRYSVLKKKGAIKELLESRQMKINFKTPVENKKVETSKGKKAQPSASMPDSEGKEVNVANAVLIGLTILNTLALTFMLLSALIK